MIDPPPQNPEWNWIWQKWMFNFWDYFKSIKTKIFPGDNGEGWTDYLSSLSSGKTAGSSVPTWTTYRDGIKGFAFAPTGGDEIWISFHINHDFKVGTAIYPHVHWSPNTTNTGTVRWGMEYTVAKGHQQSNFGASNTIYVEQTVGSANQYGHYIAEASDGDAISSSELEVDALVLMRIFRDGSHVNDTFPDSVFGFFVDLHVQVDRFSTLNKSPDFYA